MAEPGPADELYGLPLAGFTAARNELAARLRKEGYRAEAEAVKALAKRKFDGCLRHLAGGRRAKKAILGAIHAQPASLDNLTSSVTGK